MSVHFSDQQLAFWVSEAEDGYDVAELKKRGRPGRASTPSRVISVRLTDEELAALDSLAVEKRMLRSELVRQAIAALTAA